MTFEALTTAYPAFERLFRNAAESDTAIPYLFLRNAAGKEWLLCLNNLRSSLSIYQPSALKGRLLHLLLPTVCGLSGKIACKLTGGSILFLAPTEEFRKLLTDVFDGEMPDVSVFFGTPGVHKKMTLQFSSGKELFAYGKLASSADTLSLVAKENDILTSLAATSFEAMPHVIYYGTPFDASSLLIQSTEKTPSSKTAHRLGIPHYQAIVDLIGATAKSLPYAETDFAADMKRFRDNLQLRISYSSASPFVSADGTSNTAFKGPEEAGLCSLLTDCIDRVTAAESDYETVTYAMCHGDFTPWNTYLTKDGLQLFDWEYAHATYPLYYDIFHFALQTAYFEKHLTAEETCAYLSEKLLQEISGITDEGPFLLVQYLLGILALYVLRADITTPLTGCHEMVSFWLTILELGRNLCEL